MNFRSPGFAGIDRHRKLLLLLAATALAQPYPTNAAPPGSALHAELAAFDARVFDALEAKFDEDVEFYHDQGGVTIGAAKVTAQVKANICGKARPTGIAQFVHLVRKQPNGAWKITRVLSFDHVGLERYPYFTFAHKYVACGFIRSFRS